MSPPTATEQLIRDYLSKVAVAARDFSADDRRALLERTRSLIEQRADLANRPSTMDVARVLARLGTPVARVEQERRRLAAGGRSGRPATEGTPSRPRFLARALGREHGRVRGPSVRWPAQQASGSDVPLPPSSEAASGIREPGMSAESDASADSAASRGVAALGEAAAAASQPAPSPSPSASSAGDGPAAVDGPLPESPAPSPSGTDGIAAPPPDAGLPQPQLPPSVVQQGSRDPGTAQQPVTVGPPGSGTNGGSQETAAPGDEAAASGTRSGGEGVSGAATVAAASGRDSDEDHWERRRAWRASGAAPRGLVRQQIGRLLAWARRRPLEAAVIVIMGIGGPIFPPVFLIGATLALASEVWDGRDKWVGLAMPVVLTVIGLAVGVAAGGRSHWMHESWVYLDVVSRIAPVLGAGYLAWRCHHPRHPSATPPFIRPRRV